MTNLEKLVNAAATAEQALHAGIVEEYPLGSRSLVMDKIRRSFDKVSR